MPVQLFQHGTTRRYRGNFLIPTTELYFECHITVEPLFDERLADFKEIAQTHQFRIADLLMQKRATDTPERSQHDSFCTGRSTDYEDLWSRMCALVNDLGTTGIRVWRYKIENTLLDSNVQDSLGLLPSG